MKLTSFEVGQERPFFLIAGPCVIESEDLVVDVAGRLKEMTAALRSRSSSRLRSTRPIDLRAQASEGPA